MGMEEGEVTILYAKVSSKKQQSSIDTQISYMKKNCRLL